MPNSSSSSSNTSGHHWSQERLHADVNRAVGGALNLVREFARISSALDTSIPAEWLVKRLQFLSYELQSLIPTEATDADRLRLLNLFLFESKRFSCVDTSHQLLDNFCLSRVLVDRSGSALVLELIYAFLAERIGVVLDFVDLKPTCFLRWVDRTTGRSRFIDVTRGGATLSSDELIETLVQRFRMSSECQVSLLETYSFESYVSDYTRVLKAALDTGREPEKALFLQDTLISYQPSNLQLIAERALLHRRLGNFKQALADLKRYFAFHDRMKASRDLSALYDELLQMYERRPDAEI